MTTATVPTTSLRIFTLGGLRATLGDEELDWVGSQPIRSGLLLYLSIEGCAPRDKLARIFWPNQELDRARHSLSQTLYLLRRGLGEDVIKQQGDVLAIGISVAVDSNEFETAAEAGDFVQALALYHGAFLCDTHLTDAPDFQQWVDTQRARLSRTHRRICRAHIDALRATGDTTAATEAARQWVAVEPFEDEARHCLIQLLAAAGQRQEALAEYDAFERLLRADDLEPLVETKSMVAGIRADTGEPHPTLTPARQTPALTLANSRETAPPPPRILRLATPRRELEVVSAIVIILAVLVLWMSRRAWSDHKQVDNTGPEPNSIGVLSFDDLSDSADREFFAAAISEELLIRLHNLGFMVPARTSSFAFKGKNQDATMIAAALNVAYLLDGSVAWSGDDLKVRVWLVDGRTGRTIWSHVYTGATGDVFSVQDNITSAIVASLDVTLTAVAAHGVTDGKGLQVARVNREAYLDYLRGTAANARESAAGWREAVAAFERAIEIEGRFARAHAGRAWALSMLSIREPDSAQRRALLESARSSAERALELDSTLADPHLVLARVIGRMPGPWTNGRRPSQEVSEALRLDPRSRWGRNLRAIAYKDAGDRWRAVGDIDTMLIIDPVSPATHYMAASMLNAVGDYRRADAIASNGLKLDSMGFGQAATYLGHWNRGFAHLMLGNYAQSASFFERSAELYGGSRNRIRNILNGIAAYKGNTRASSSARLAAIRAVDQLARDDAASLVVRQPLMLALFYFLLDDRPRTYAVLEDAVAKRDMNLVSQITLAAFDPLRSEPRFSALLAQEADWLRH